MKKKRIAVMMFLLLLLGSVVFYVLYYFNYIPHKKYDNAHFGIETYMSSYDMDEDGVDDQTDILKNVRDYISTNPKYKSKYYQTGYPNDEYGVCTDVVAQGLLHAGYDLQKLVDQDKRMYPEDYNREEPDDKIDFRRVRNLKIFFKRYAQSLTTDIHEIDQWQGGDIVIFHKHIGILSDKRNKDGVSFVIHHANPAQRHYEEDILEFRDDLVGHYRVDYVKLMENIK